jgi:hypothetical protein
MTQSKIVFFSPLVLEYVRKLKWKDGGKVEEIEDVTFH